MSGYCNAHPHHQCTGQVEWDENTLSAMSLSNNEKPVMNNGVVSSKPRRVSNKITVKEITERLKYATTAEMVKLLYKILKSEPVAAAVLANYTPDFPVATDPILFKCFHCKSDGRRSELFDFYGVKICAKCYDFVAYRRLTRQKVMDVFSFTKAEAMKIPGRKAPQSAYSGYEFNLEKVIKAIEKRDGSFVRFVEHSHGRCHTHTALELLLAAPTKTDRKSMLKLVLQASKDSTLKRLIKEAVKFSPGLKAKGGVLEAFLLAES